MAKSLVNVCFAKGEGKDPPPHFWFQHIPLCDAVNKRQVASFIKYCGRELMTAIKKVI